MTTTVASRFLLRRGWSLPSWRPVQRRRQHNQRRKPPLSHFDKARQCRNSPHRRGQRQSISFLQHSYLEDFHHFVAEMIDDLHGDTTGLRLVEWARGVAV